MYIGVTVAPLLVVVVVVAVTLPTGLSRGRKLASVRGRLRTQQAWLAVVERATHTSVLVVRDDAARACGGLCGGG